MTRITLGGLFLLSLLGAWAQAQRQDANEGAFGFSKRNTNNVRLVNKDFNAYREATDAIFGPPTSAVISDAANSDHENEVSQPGSGEFDRLSTTSEYEPYELTQYKSSSQPRPYWEERTYEFQYGEPRVYRDIQEPGRQYNRVDGFLPPVKEEVLVSDLNVYGENWTKFSGGNKAQQVQNIQQPAPAPPAVQQQESEYIDILAPAEPCTVTEVLTTTYYVKPRPVVTEYTVSTVLLECPHTPTPPVALPAPYYAEPYYAEPHYVEPYFTPCEVCDYPHKCDHCPAPPRPRVTRPPVYTAPIYKIPCDKCRYPDNCDHCPKPLPHPQMQPQPHPAPCELCTHPQNCDHCYQVKPRPYQAPCEVCTVPQNCDHCPQRAAPHYGQRQAQEHGQIPCEVCERDPQGGCDHCQGPQRGGRPRNAGGVGKDKEAPRVVVQPKRYPQVGPQVISGDGKEPVENDGDK